MVSWKIKKFVGGTEQTLRTKIALGSARLDTGVRKEIGPIRFVSHLTLF
jgi:hypothetical protein